MRDTYETKVPVTTVGGDKPQRIVPSRTRVRHNRDAEREAFYVIVTCDEPNLCGDIIAVPHRQKSAILESTD